MLTAGQKIVFVGRGEAKFPHLLRKVDVPIKGQIYTVRDVYVDTHQPGGVIGIHLMEVRNPPEPFAHPAGCGYDGREIGWVADEFRPIVEKKTSIEVFEKMLKLEREKV